MPGEPQSPQPYGPAGRYPQQSGHVGYPPPVYPPAGWAPPGPQGPQFGPSWAYPPGYQAGPLQVRPAPAKIWSTRTTMFAVLAALIISSLSAVAAAAADKAPSTTQRITGFQIPGNGGGNNGSFGRGSTTGGFGGFGGGFAPNG